MESTDSLLGTYHRQGYVIIRDVLDAAEIDAKRAALQPYLATWECQGATTLKGRVRSASIRWSGARALRDQRFDDLVAR